MAAKIIDNSKVVLGQMVKVQNQNKRNLQNDNYIAIQVEDQDGNNERCLLFTEIELADMPKIESSLLDKNMIAGRIYVFVIGKRTMFLIKVINSSGQNKILRIGVNKFKIAQKRSLKNKQDLTKKSFLTDIMD